MLKFYHIINLINIPSFFNLQLCYSCDYDRRYSNFKNIYICPINASIDCKNNMADYVHPTQEGYEEIGTMLYGFIRGIN